jgi:putative flavoprotein involved in K+ transport
MEKELIIIGSGPAGLKAGEEAQKQGIDYLILEKGKIGQAWRDIRPSMPMLSPNHPQRDWTSISNVFPIWKLDIKRPYCSADEFVKYLDEFAAHLKLNIRTGTEVKDITQRDELFTISTTKGTFRAQIVLNSSGFFGNPYIPGIPGMRNNHVVCHSHTYQDEKMFRNKRVVIIGGGNSAAEIAIDMVGHSQVYLITRGELQFFSKTKNLCHIRGISESLLNELIAMELIHYIPNAQIKKVKDSRLYYNDQFIETNHIICATGYRPTLDHFKSIPINLHKDNKFPVVDQNCAAQNMKNLYFAGPLGYTGLSSLFIHGFIKTIPSTMEVIKNQLSI